MRSPRGGVGHARRSRAVDGLPLAVVASALEEGGRPAGKRDALEEKSCDERRAARLPLSCSARSGSGRRWFWAPAFAQREPYLQVSPHTARASASACEVGCGDRPGRRLRRTALHHTKGASASGRVAERAIEVDRGADQSEVGERLGKVAEVRAVGGGLWFPAQSVLR